MHHVQRTHLSLALAALLAAAPAAAQTKRALVIGIDQYLGYSRETLTAWRAQLPTLPNAPAEGGSRAATRAPVIDLEGARADAIAIAGVLEAQYQFAPERVRLLLDSAATRTGILEAIRTLTDEAQRGDVVVFYYAGHGAQRVNSLTLKPTHLDQTIVPADANAGQYDIRDKELATLFDRLLDKGVTLTLIFDSCHSGSITRGASGLVRFAGIDPRDSRDASRPIPPEDRGALVLSAAQDYQVAAETVDPDGVHHGLFTSALLRVMAADPTEPAHEMYQRVRAMMQSEGGQQEPVIKGIEADRRRLLFGPGSGELSGRVTVALRRIDGDTARLLGGTALGFGPGTELVLATTRGIRADSALRLRITEVAGMGSSSAVAIGGRLTGINPGALFVIDRWAPPDRPVLRLFLPPSSSPAELTTAAQLVTQLRGNGSLDLVTDPDVAARDARPLYIAYRGASGWIVRSPAGDTVRLADLTAAALAGAVATQAHTLAQRNGQAPTGAPAAGLPRLLLLVPPAPALRGRLQFGAGSRNSAITLASRPDDADYMLAGRLDSTRISYAWLSLGGLLEPDRLSSLPTHTNWQLPEDAADSLAEVALRLARVNGWLTLAPPPDTGAFPYHFAIRNVATGATKTSGETSGGESYQLLLRRDSVLRSPLVTKRWVYVFAIDSHGNGTPLYPQRGAVENRVPFDSAGARDRVPLEIVLPRTRPVGIRAPFGVDTWIMVTSDEPIDLETFRFSGVERGGPESASGLSALLSGVGSATRAPGDPVPADWSIERLVLRSRPQGAAAPTP